MLYKVVQKYEITYRIDDIRYGMIMRRMQSINRISRKFTVMISIFAVYKTNICEHLTFWKLWRHRRIRKKEQSNSKSQEADHAGELPVDPSETLKNEEAVQKVRLKYAVRLDSQEQLFMYLLRPDRCGVKILRTLRLYSYCPTC